MKLHYRAMAVCAALALIGVTGCGKKEDGAQAAAAQQAPTATVDVQVITLGATPIGSTFSGRVMASETSEVRPQVSGYVDEILFQEGSAVKAGQPLYRINVDSYTSSVAANEASVNQARANVGTARASLLAQQATYEQARADLARLDGLLEVDAVSRQAVDQARTAVKTAQAGVEQARANLASSEATVRAAEASLAASRLDLDRTIVRAPISGKAGISSVTKGALVSAGQSTALVTISRLNPVFVDISQSSADLLKLRQAIASGSATYGTSQVQLTLEDGTTYPETGQIAMDNAEVDANTGSVTLRAVFANPHGILLPGMYVDANLHQTVVQNAALLPQTAIMRTAKGESQVYVVNAENKIESRNVVTSGTHNGNWVVTDGLKTGDKVVVMGAAKVKPEQVVQVRVLPATNESGAKAAATQAPQQAPSARAGQNSVLSSNAAGAQTATSTNKTTPANQPASNQATPAKSAGQSSNNQAASSQTTSNQAPKASAQSSAPTTNLSADEQEAMAAAD